MDCLCKQHEFIRLSVKQKKILHKILGKLWGELK